MQYSIGGLDLLAGKKIFLTGGTGFFGKWLLAALTQLKFAGGGTPELTVLSRDPEAFVARWPEVKTCPGMTFLRGDITDFSLPVTRFDYIIHAATDTILSGEAHAETGRSREVIAGTQRVLEVARAGSARMLNVSSGAVYGEAAGKREGARETDFAHATGFTPYGRAKRAAEKLCRESGVDFVTARAFAFLGPHLPLNAHFAAGNFLRDALAGGPILVRGDGSALRSYLYPTDLVGWLLAMLLHGESGEAYNVGSDKMVSTAELAREVAHAISPAVEVVIQSLQTPGPQNIYLPDIRRAQMKLGLAVTVPLNEAITRTLSSLRKQD